MIPRLAFPKKYLGAICLLFLFSLSACRAHTTTATDEPTYIPGNSTPSPGAASTSSPVISITATATVSPTATSAPALGIDFPKIDRSPRAATIADWAPWAGRILTATQAYNPVSTDPWQVDYRTQDLSGLDLRYALGDLMAAANFDDLTVWPSSKKMPFGFEPKEILEVGKNPGLGLRALHARGITGQGVGIAIIDTTLLVDHQEYRDRLRLYEELYFSDEAYQQPASMRGPAVASLAAGKSVGVAPEADLYYIAVDLAKGQDASGNYLYDFSKAAQAVRRILEINQQLPAERKIRVISISFGWASNLTGYDEINAAVAEARAQGLFVVSANPTMEAGYGFKLGGLERSPLADPDRIVSYARPQICSYYAERIFMCQAGRLLVPMSSRTAASPMGAKSYAFYRLGDESWTIPYLAGMYALAAQVDPEITPERFWDIAMQTGHSLNITGTAGIYTLGPILDPGGVIEALGKK